MVRMVLRMLLVFLLVALSGAVFGRYLRSDEPDTVIVVLVQDGGCRVASPASNESRED